MHCKSAYLLFICSPEATEQYWAPGTDILEQAQNLGECIVCIMAIRLWAPCLKINKTQEIGFDSLCLN